MKDEIKVYFDRWRDMNAYFIIYLADNLLLSIWNINRHYNMIKYHLILRDFGKVENKKDIEKYYRCIDFNYTQVVGTDIVVFGLA